MEIIFSVGAIIFLTLYLLITYVWFRSLRGDIGGITIFFEYTILHSYLLSLFFFFDRLSSAPPYHKPIERDSIYNPFGEGHILSLVVFILLFIVFSMVLWLRSKTLPPLVFCICVVFQIIGCVIFCFTILQVNFSSEEQHNFEVHNDDSFFFGLAPVMSILITFLLWLKILNETADEVSSRQYDNKTLNWLNQLIAKSKWQPMWAVILLMPVFMIVTLILMLFGQDYDSLVKVFTETTTWRFSQHSHPPYLDNQGHYLCTVAACGHPKIVKPVRLGTRHGNTIIINRQLMIANAYEEMIEKIAPRFHKIVRFLYDKYGFPISKHINTPLRSDIMYVLMKPIEWFFLLNLYLFCTRPERNINRQYNLSKLPESSKLSGSCYFTKTP